MSLPLVPCCCVCGAEPVVETTKRNWLNGLPVGVLACQACRDAVKRREVGVVVQPNGALYVTDGREKASAV